MAMTNFFSDLLNVASNGPTLIWSILLSLCLAYWVFVILGALDIEAFDLDLDVDGDVDLDIDADIDGDISGGGNPGLLIGIFKFLNLDSVPFMVFLSFFSLAAWTIGVLASSYISTDLMTGLALLIPNIFTSLILSKYITAPLAPIFKSLNDIAKELNLTGEEGTVVHGFEKGELSQAQILRNGENLLVSIRIAEDSVKSAFGKGEKVLLLNKRTQETSMWYDVTASKVLD
ncbi:MAG: hypothetical protein ACJA01_001647 [Saprospiraceae bacterium]|jgi:hypothetical protein